ncbi:MAG: hypothetical protein MJE68_29465, partial [Proteobacteria bacterium]|nr:hypothetical protein [Pseudomonadota bacterium]
IPGIPGYLVFWDSRNPLSYGTPRDYPGNPGIHSIPGLKESTVIWDTKGHPRNPGILSIPGLKVPSVIWDTKGLPRKFRDT